MKITVFGDSVLKGVITTPQTTSLFDVTEKNSLALAQKELGFELDNRSIYGNIITKGQLKFNKWLEKGGSADICIIEFGDNDTLSAVVAAIAGADMLVLLSDIDGLYTDDPNRNQDAQLIPYVERISDEMLEMAKGPSTSYGTGGMSAKIAAAGIANDAGADMAIINGDNMDNILRLMAGEEIGTVFKEHRTRHFHLKEYLNRR